MEFCCQLNEFSLDVACFQAVYSSKSSVSWWCCLWRSSHRLSNMRNLKTRCFNAVNWAFFADILAGNIPTVGFGFYYWYLSWCQGNHLGLQPCHSSACPRRKFNHGKSTPRKWSLEDLLRTPKTPPMGSPSRSVIVRSEKYTNAVPKHSHSHSLLNCQSYKWVSWSGVQETTGGKGRVSSWRLLD